MEVVFSSQFMYFLLAINVIAFALIGVDQHYSKKGKRFVLDGYILILALIGGSVGAFFGIYIFDHRRQNKVVKYGILVIYIVQFALGVRYGLL